MVEIRRAILEDVAGICSVCSEGWRHTYEGLETPEHIESVIKEFYNEERVAKEVTDITDGWNGYFVAVENGKVVGAGGGGCYGEATSELYVIYLDPSRKREGIGKRLLAAITEDQVARGAKEQWVSVTKGNEMGIPFYEAVGFEFVEERPDYFDPENGAPSLRYRREIG